MSAGATLKIAIQNVLTFLQDRSRERLNGVGKTCLIHAQVQSQVAEFLKSVCAHSFNHSFSPSERSYAVNKSCFASREWVALFVRFL